MQTKIRFNINASCAYDDRHCQLHVKREWIELACEAIYICFKQTAISQHGATQRSTASCTSVNAPDHTALQVAGVTNGNKSHAQSRAGTSSDSKFESPMDHVVAVYRVMRWHTVGLPTGAVMPYGVCKSWSNPHHVTMMLLGCEMMRRRRWQTGAAEYMLVIGGHARPMGTTGSGSESARQHVTNLSLRHCLARNGETRVHGASK
eukprot:6173228-Pleurochrysis_carterae.AAC.1